ncbi:hypothetical protein NitYY0826_C0022 [Nitratiruptor sp. YY08-26]|uniref:SagB family peptide dehydrogenase n=1 Tax=unclassified Nitratiruptor TaxID=2624044 RepID=UPI001915CA26|nr:MULTISPECIES: SagB family peptide dehydrogenase [unclassified Nitratiruptor]BCD61189.1 hypothetical protein NitYY0813_C0022 [Nitratiruptor sp. YY08-13]BCD65122.1 hypothetical protein NitYY0826_C0022 [Nitratiruptor sp. YY08-26]
MTNTYHEATKHSYWSVRRNPNYLDWSKQPNPFKIYPTTYPFIPLDMENPLHKFIYRIGGINAKKVYPGVEYYLRTIPSAGALYPVEIYFQARDVEGLDNGIYHFSVVENGPRLLHTLKEKEGIEIFFARKRKIKGFIFLFSIIYYRSSWKYKNRAFRYCLLDAGHVLGALEVSSYLFERAYYILYDFNKEALNEAFGFENKEFFVSSAVVGVPTQTEAKEFGMKLPFVDGTKTFEQNSLIEEAYKDTLHLKNCKANFRFPKFPFEATRLEEAILKRRSIRDFSAKVIKKEQFNFILSWMQSPIPSDCDEEVKVWYVVNRVEGMEQGLYRDGELIKMGDFHKKAGYLCLEQALGSQSSVTFFLTSNGKNYQPLYQKAGHIGHRCYIASEYLGIGCSGIGAYYDDEVNEFLGSNDMVLYALAIGL